MPPRLEKAALVVHVSASVGWLGAVVAFLALALAGLGGGDATRTRAAYLAMDVLARLVLVPLAFASLATGVMQALGTRWGLLRHYWVVAKLLITLVSTLLLLVHLQPVVHVAQAAAEGPLADDALRPARVQLVADAALAIVALLAATALSVVKPRGLTPYGLRRQREARAPRP
ncbi:MAG TPA: hypothetical protein VNX21_08915 [Candidatus Thermoplasmatota archaeon]|nr:hypothetical protein [Candidatus Thermoplasmatota archaeon]